MTPADINPWLTLGVSATALGGVVWSLLTSAGAKALKEVGELRQSTALDEKKAAELIAARFQLLESRVLVIEGELKHMPNLQLVHELQLALKDIQLELSKVASSAEQSARTSSRVEAYLLEHGK